MSGVFGYENACGQRERLECPYSTCDGCPLNPKHHEVEAQGKVDEGETDEDWTLYLTIPNRLDNGVFPTRIVVDEDGLGRDDLETESRTYLPETGGECLLRHNGKHTGIVIEPEDLECTNCGYSREYFFWYEATGFHNRLVNYCPRCGMKIFGAVTVNE